MLILAATHDFFDIQATWVSFRHAKRLYSRMGFAERVDLPENDAKHNYDKLPREGAVRWMSRWLLKRDGEINEPRIETMTDEQLRCTPRGQVMMMPGARSVYDLSAEREMQLAARHEKLWAAPTARRVCPRTVGGWSGVIYGTRKRPGNQIVTSIMGILSYSCIIAPSRRVGPWPMARTSRTWPISPPRLPLMQTTNRTRTKAMFEKLSSSSTRTAAAAANQKGSSR